MNLQDLAKMLRSRWITVAVTTLAITIAAIAYTLLTTPLYQASTRLYVSTTAGVTASELYNGNRLSQERVLSYTELLEGTTLAQRTIDKLDLTMTAQTLQQRVNAQSKIDTVLITLKVLDESPVRSRDIANAMSDEFVAMVRELETPRPGDNPNARVVVEQRASIPSHPVVPNPPKNIAIGLILGLAAGFGLAFVRDLLDNTIKDHQTIEQITGAGVVGAIPLDKERRNTPAIAFDSDHSAIAEAFRKLRTNLQFLAVDNPPRVIVVTSSLPAEGKSTTSINIALALAEAEHNVVLVDGDLRRPSVHRLLDLVGSVGFSTVLSGAATLDDVLQETKFPRLTVLAAGPVAPNPSELLGSSAAVRVLSELRAKFDYIIVDSSPLLAVTDSAILAAKSDGTLLVARYGVTKREQLAHAVGNVKDVGAVVLGAISTMEPTSGSGYYRYNYYGGYGEGEKTRASKHATNDAAAAGASHLEELPEDANAIKRSGTAKP